MAEVNSDFCHKLLNFNLNLAGWHVHVIQAFWEAEAKGLGESSSLAWAT